MMFERLRRLLTATVRRQLTIGIVLVVSLSMSLFIWDMARRQHAGLTMQQRDQGLALAHSVGMSSAVWLASRDYSGLQEIVDGIAQFPDLQHAIVLDLHGQVLAHNDASKRGLYLSDLPRDVKDLLLSNDNLTDVASPIMLAGKHIGWARIGLNHETIHAKMRRVVIAGAIYGLSAIVLSTLFVMLAARYLTRRLYAIQQVADAMQSGDSRVRAAVSGEDEAAQLALRFNTMLDSLEQRETELRTFSEELERHRNHLEEMVEARTRELGRVNSVLETEIVLHKKDKESLDLFNRDFEAFLYQTTDFIYFKDINSRFRFCSQTLAAITGHADWHDMIGKHDREVFPPDTAKIYEDEEIPVFSEGQSLLNKIDPYYDATGRLGYVQTNKWPLFDTIGKVAGIFGISRDITERLAAEKALHVTTTRLEQILEAAGEGIYGIDADNRVIFANRAAADLLGYPSVDSLLGRSGEEAFRHVLASRRPCREGDCPIRRALKDGDVFRCSDEFFQRADGTHFPVEYIVAPNIQNGEILGAVVSFQDISERRHAEQEREKMISELQKALAEIKTLNQLLERQATTDPLTGIFNRLKFDEVLITELSRAKRHAIPLSLVMFDIDHFKKINDTFGHHIGDMVLKDLTAHMSNKIRKHDCFARWGGEEFMILLPHATLDQAAQFAEKCRIAVEMLTLGGVEGATCSFGVTELRADDTIDSFGKRVDEALYKAKAGGRNRVESL